MTENRQPITVRMLQEEKDILIQHTDACGLELSVGARQVLTLCVYFLSRGGAARWPELIHRIDQALKDAP